MTSKRLRDAEHELIRTIKRMWRRNKHAQFTTVVDPDKQIQCGVMRGEWQCVLEVNHRGDCAFP